MELPEQFEATIGGYMGSAFWIKLVDGVLEYRQAEHSYEYGEPEYLELSARKWSNFRKKLGTIGIWDWKPTDDSDPWPAYGNPGVTDGTGWSLDIKWGDRSLNSSGDNNFPQCPAAPSKLEFRWWAMTGPLLEVNGFGLADDPGELLQIDYHVRGEDDDPGLRGDGHPSSAAWYAFSRCLDEIGAWSWDRHYSLFSDSADYVTDLPGWEFTFVRERKRLKSGGYAAYPEGWERFCSAVADLARDAARPSRRQLTAFDEYLHAVRLLIGGRLFS